MSQRTGRHLQAGAPHKHVVSDRLKCCRQSGTYCCRSKRLICSSGVWTGEQKTSDSILVGAQSCRISQSLFENSIICKMCSETLRCGTFLLYKNHTLIMIRKKWRARRHSQYYNNCALQLKRRMFNTKRLNATFRSKNLIDVWACALMWMEEVGREL